MNVIGYCRVSTDKQADFGCSLEMQESVIRNEYEKLNLSQEDHLEILIDDGYSAGSLNRPKMSILIELIKSKQIDLIIAYDLARLSRSLVDTIYLLQLIKENNVELVCIYDTTRFETASDRFSTSLKALANEYERSKVSERVKSTYRSIVENEERYPYGGKAIFGYKRINKQLVINPSESLLVLQIFKSIADNESIGDVCREVNKICLNRKFDPSAIRRLIQDRKYSGRVKFRGKVIENLVPAIVSKELQEKAIKKLKRYSSKDNTDYLFDKKLVCSCCGSHLVCHSGYGKAGKKYLYYKCPKCTKYISQELLNDYFYKIEKNINQYEKKVLYKNLKKRQYVLNRKIKKLKDKYICEALDQEKYYILILPLMEELSNIQIQLSVEKMLMKGLSYKNLVTKSEKKIFIEKYIDEILVSVQTKQIKKVIFIKN